MSFSTLPLSYCGNVHPANSLADICSNISSYTSAVQQNLERPIAAGLWLSAPIIQEMTNEPGLIEQLKQSLSSSDLVCYTLNSFPYGNFHSERVKEQVYIPDWTTDDRLIYTRDCATILADLLPTGVEGSLSTVPLGFKNLAQENDFQQECIKQLLQLARDLDELHDQTGKIVRLAIEPEPLCVLETTAELLAFFETLFQQAEGEGLLDVVKRHLGVCYDVCHQSVEFEDVQQSIQQIHEQDIRINKIHITCAIELPDPASNISGREQLADFEEIRYLHQTFASTKTKGAISELDLSREFAISPPEEFLEADMWRIHFHVPVHLESFGDLKTTRPDLKAALAAVRELEYAPHLEVETYTWSVMPGEVAMEVTEGMTREMQATYELLDELSKED